MMQKNERSLLEPWLIYHGDLFGYNNLYVWDNGSSDKTILPLIEKYTYRGVNFLDGARRQEKYREKGVFIGNKIKDLQIYDHYDFFIPADCDEFLCLKEPSGSNIITDRDDLLGHFDSLDKGQGLFKIGFNFPNDLSNPGKFFGWEYDKKFVRSGVFKRMDHGGHQIETIEPMQAIDSGFAFIHFCFRAFDEAKVNAIDKLMLTPEVLDWPTEKLRHHRVGRVLTMTEEEYIESLGTMNANKAYRAPSLEKFFAEFGRHLPFS